MAIRFRLLAYTACMVGLGACGGGIDGSIGGTLSGLTTGSTVTLVDNGTDTLTLSADGTFTFADTIADSGAYNVSVQTQPTGETCIVVDGSCTVDATGDPVTAVEVTCSTSSSLGGTVSGLPAGTSVTLSNAGNIVAVATNGTFAFTDILSAGTTYDVIVTQEPVGALCTVANASGTITANVVSSVTVTCTPS